MISSYNVRGTKSFVPQYEVNTGATRYPVVVESGVLGRVGSYLPSQAGRVFVVTTEDVWRLHGASLNGVPNASTLFLPGGESTKRLAPLEKLAEQMIGLGGDRSSLVIAFGGGIVGDMGGFLAAIFMRGIPVIQIPTTLLAQVDAAVGGKTGVNLTCGKNLIGSFHQPRAVLIDPEVLRTLPEREYRAGLFEVLKHGVIASAPLFELMEASPASVLKQEPSAVLMMISESVRIKSEVVSTDEREGGLRRILNFGHTFGHALEAETGYTHFLHGEAVGIGMKMATHLAQDLGMLAAADADRILTCIDHYGPFPSLDGIRAEAILARLASDKKTVRGKVHFVLPDSIGHTQVRNDVEPEAAMRAIRAVLQ
jgi:3-dehydroquinate synthase